MAVTAVSFQVDPALVEYCHFKMDPTLPALGDVNVPLFPDTQTLVPPETVPATVIGSIVIVAIAEYTGVHAPF